VFTAQPAESAVIGIDLGGEFFKVRRFQKVSNSSNRVRSMLGSSRERVRERTRQRARASAREEERGRERERETISESERLDLGASSSMCVVFKQFRQGASERGSERGSERARGEGVHGPRSSHDDPHRSQRSVRCGRCGL
jgi:hypothetical protein